MSCSTTATPVTSLDSNSLAQRKAQLTPLEYRVTQEKATERPFSNRYNRHWERGSYHCVLCNIELFKSESKFESKSGWPAFDNVIDTGRVKLKPDLSHVGANILLLVSRPDLARTEVSCSNCNAHLGHLFKDGPKPTGLRYCINSSSLNFVPADTSPPPTLIQPQVQVQPSSISKKVKNCENDMKTSVANPVAAVEKNPPIRVVPAKMACGGGDFAGTGNSSQGKICLYTRPSPPSKPTMKSSSGLPNIGRSTGLVSRRLSAFQSMNGHAPEVVSRRPSEPILRETAL